LLNINEFWLYGYKYQVSAAWQVTVTVQDLSALGKVQ